MGVDPPLQIRFERRWFLDRECIAPPTVPPVLLDVVGCCWVRTQRSRTPSRTRGQDPLAPCSPAPGGTTTVIGKGLVCKGAPEDWG
jgi:hypothetical protein